MHVSEHQLPLGLPPVWRPHGDHREINGRSDPTSFPTQAVDSCIVKSLSHFEKFARPAALLRRVSCHRNIPSFTRLMINATTPQHLTIPVSVDSLITAMLSEFLICPHTIPIAPPRPPQTRAASF